MAGSTHIINKQVFEIRLNTSKDARSIQEAVSNAYKNYVVPVIGRIADRYCHNGNIIKIDKIEIDIGSISIDKLSTEFPQKVERILEDTLIKKLNYRKSEPDKEYSPAEEDDSSTGKIASLQIKSGEDNDLEILNYFLLTGALPWWSMQDSKSSVQRITEELLETSPGKVKNLFLKLFKNQNVRKRFVYQFNESVVRKTIKVVIQSKAEPIIELINLINKVQSYNPFIHLSSSEFSGNTWEIVLQYIIENFNSLKNNQLNESGIIEYILKHQLYRTGKGTIYQRDFSDILSGIEKSINSIKSAEILRDLIRLDSIIKMLIHRIEDTKESIDNISEPSGLSCTISDEKDLRKEDYFHEDSLDAMISGKSMINKNDDEEFTDSDIRDRIERNEKKSTKKKVNVQKKSGKFNQKFKNTDSIDKVNNISDPDNPKQDILPLHYPESEHIEQADLTKEKSVITDTDSMVADEKDNTLNANFPVIPEIESEHINNAGLVILWPYLNTFFERLNLVKDKLFISNEARYRAVLILQYLVTELEETPEHELLFNKLLCGLDIYEPVPISFKITENEKEECDALLQSVINNWTVLKNTSTHGLRITFLQKEGVLSKQTIGWKLSIERTTVDVLLERLPWSISMIVLPWGNEMIFVEW